MTSRIFSIRRSAILEIALFLAVMLIVDFIWFGGHRYVDAHPHPFWIIVLLVTVQYGINEGLLAAVASTLALLIGNLPDQSVNQDFYAYLFSLTITPILWLTAAIVLGEIRQRQLNDANELRRQLVNARKGEDTIAKAYSDLKSLKDTLEISIAGQLRTALTTYQAAKSLETLQPAEVVKGIENLISRVMNPNKFSVFLLDGNKLVLTVKHGWSAEDRFAEVHDSASPLFTEVVGRGRLLCAVNSDDEQLLGDEGVLAGPMVHPETGETIGMLKIEAMPFLELNLTSVETFRALCEWTGVSYANANRYQKASSESLMDSSTELFSHHFFGRQTNFLLALAKRADFDLSMLTIRLDNAGELSESKRKAAAQLLSRIVRQHLRLIDQAFDYQSSGSEYAILLPATAADNIKKLTDKIMSLLQSERNRSTRDAVFSCSAQALYRKGSKA